MLGWIPVSMAQSRGEYQGNLFVILPSSSNMGEAFWKADEEEEDSADTGSDVAQPSPLPSSDVTKTTYFLKRIMQYLSQLE